jgi:hypothetical protein
MWRDTMDISVSKKPDPLPLISGMLRDNVAAVTGLSSGIAVALAVQGVEQVLAAAEAELGISPELVETSGAGTIADRIPASLMGETV